MDNTTTVDSVFQERFSNLMKERGITQAEASDGIGVTRQAISLYATGKRTPDMNSLYRICDYFQVSADYLLGLSEVQSFDLDVKAISEKTGLSDYSVDMLITYNEFTLSESLIPVVDYLIEQEKPLYFEAEENYLCGVECQLDDVSADEDEYEELEARRGKLDNEYLEWKNNHTPLLKIIEDYFSASISDEKLYITGETIKKEGEFKSTVQKNVTAKREVEAYKLVEQVFISEVGDALKELKKRFIETKPRIYSINFE
ncbi:helix-turn-helix transcriptional regulator [Eubacteriaceae bacterium ES3]|nr:helix-turn-helix transcriptional regulator [Eubacteriaceae bacterium ES3]